MEIESRWIVVVASKLIVKTLDTFEEAVAWVEKNNVSNYEFFPVKLPKED